MNIDATEQGTENRGKNREQEKVMSHPINDL